MEKTYNHKKIESQVQSYWEKNLSFKVKENNKKNKYYCLSMLPYPSGKLHMGHVRNYTIGDIIARYQRMLGKNVLHPIGWDAFGLPAEEAAIQNNISPAKWTYKNIKYMKKQLKSLGLSYDWTKEITTCKPEFYKWEQWFFIKLYKKNLVYKKKSLVNWCPNENTVLANEQVTNGACWRCSTKVIKKNISQWFIKITNYAERLLLGLEQLHDWPLQVKNMQKNWIGKSTGVEFTLHVFKSSETIKIFTTRLDCIMGATFVAISPYHNFSKKISKSNILVKQFIKTSINDLALTTNTQHIKNTGLNTYKFAIHPINKTLLPIWIANFVKPDYGSGAIIAVPAHNLNDWNFAITHQLKIKPVILCINGNKPNSSDLPMITKGNLFNSGKLLNGLKNEMAINIIKKLLKKNNYLKDKNVYKIKDWNISRQRYWGAPIPIVEMKNKKLFVIPEENLPVVLPENIPIKKLYDSNKKNIFNNYNIYIKGKKINCKIDTFDTFMESSWYYLRYTNPNFNTGMIDPKASKYWLPIDYYIGGIEHAVMHLLYFRFYHKLLKDFNLVTTEEPVKKLLCQGMVLSDAFYILENNKKIWIKPKDVIFSYDKNKKITNVYDKTHGKKITYAGKIKMSKSKKNGIEPSSVIKNYGADSLRLFIIVAAPIESSLEWNENGVKGAYRFLQKLWKITYNFLQNKKIKSTNNNTLNKRQKKIECSLNNTILKVSHDIKKRQSFNTAISTIFKFVNILNTFKITEPQDHYIMRKSLLTISKMLYPFTPHFSYTLLFHLRKNKETINYEKWPKPNINFIKNNIINVIIQIDGKTRQILKCNNTIQKDTIILMAKNDIKISKYLHKKCIKKTIFIPNKLINFVIH